MHKTELRAVCGKQ